VTMVPVARAVDEAIQTVAGFLVADSSLGKTLERVATLASEALGPAAAVGITLLDESNRPATRISTGDFARRVDQAQYDEDDGPCLEAYRQNRTIRVDDCSAVARTWPEYSRVAAEEGVKSTLSLPLAAAGKAFGAFNLYARDAHSFSSQDESDAELFSTQAAVVLANARAYWGAFDLATGLRTAMESRATIEQAKGILMASRHCSPEDAFRMLVTASQRNNVKLRDLANRIVAGSKAGPGAEPT
jgi:transcriptional regulator with GAF, ATPase, and Fis domain